MATTLQRKGETLRPDERDGLHYILDNMTFSFSNIQAFDTCPRMWQLKYLDCRIGESNIYAKFGTCCHHVIQDYVDGKVPKDDLRKRYDEEFAKCVDDCPPDFMNDKTYKFYENGVTYFEYEADTSVVDRVIKLYQPKYNRYEVFTEYYFEYIMPSNGRKFCGYIDLLIAFYDENGKVVDVLVVDHKSGKISINKSGGISQANLEKYEQYKRQLHLYADFVKYEFGLYPRTMMLNFINDRRLLGIAFSEDDHDDVLLWINNTIESMYETESFEMTGPYFFCKKICEYRDGNC